MATILPSSPQKYSKGMRNTPPRASVRTLTKSGKTQLQIFSEAGIPQPTISRILNAETSCNTQKGKQYKTFKLSQIEVRKLIRRLSTNFSSRQLSYSRLRTDGLQHRSLRFDNCKGFKESWLSANVLLALDPL